MRIKKFSLFVLFLIIFLYTQVSNAEEKRAKHIWKMASNAPIGFGVELIIRNHLNPDVKKATNGDVVFSWYHGGIMGDNRDWLGKMKIDQLQGAGLDGSGVQLACPEMYVLQLPFMFRNFDEIAYIKKMVRSRIYDVFEKNGYKLLILLDQAFDTIYSIKRPIRTPDDFAETKFASYCGIVEQEIFRSLGATPILLSVPEIASGTRSGVTNGLLCPELWYLGAQLYTLGGYITRSKIRYAQGAILITLKAWNKISEKHKKAIEKASTKVESLLDQDLKEFNIKAHKAMLKYGMKEVNLTADELGVLKKTTRPIWNKFAGKLYPKEFLEEILSCLKQYREEKK